MQKAKCKIGSRATASVATPAEIRIARADTPGRYRDFQKFMFRAVTRPLTQDDRADPRWDDGRPAEALLGAFVKGDAFRNPLERVQTYNRMYWYRTLDSLWEDFPGVRAITGTKFLPLAEAYLVKHPSTAFTLRRLGHAFPEWLRENTAKLPAKVALAAAECAELERALCTAFEYEGRDPLEALPPGDPARLRLGLQPHLTLLATTHDIPDFLETLRLADNEHAEAGNAAATAGPSEKPGRRPGVTKPRAGKTFAAVFRTRDNAVATVKLEPGEHALLADLVAGKTLGAAVTAASRRRNAPSADTLGAWFAAWTRRGWLIVR